MLTKNIRFKNFKFNKDDKKIKKDLKNLLNKKSEIIRSLTPNYKYAYSKKLINKIKTKTPVKIIGMGGSILGSQAIFDFLK